jgi:hypothetical protein
MKKLLFVLVFSFFTVVFSAMLADDHLLFAEYPPEPTGCCMQRDWLAAKWRKTQIGFTACAQLNRHRDGLDNLFAKKGYVWWDNSCNL